MIEWFKKLGNDLMPEEQEHEVTAKERATSPEHIDGVNALGRAQYRLALRGITNPSVSELFDERDREYGFVINVDLHEDDEG